MAISRITANTVTASSVTPSGYQSGDYVVFGAIEMGSSTPINTPSGNTLIASATDSTNSWAMHVSGVFATSSASIGTVTYSLPSVNAISYVVYRGVNATTPFSNASGQAGTGTTISYSGIVTMTQAGGAGTSWVVYCGTADSGTAAVNAVPPTATTLISATQNVHSTAPVFELDFFDTNTTKSSASFNSKTLAASAPWLTKMFELNAAAAGGGTTAYNLMMMGVGS